MSAPFRPMPLTRLPEPFDDREWVFEIKYDGFRALAFADRRQTRLVSRRDVPYRGFADLAAGISGELDADDAVLDGEIVKLDEAGRPAFAELVRRRGPFAFVVFDVLSLNGQDLRRYSLLERKRVLRELVGRRGRAMFRADHVRERGRELFALVCQDDLEGIVAKRAGAPYDAERPSWAKIKNPDYSQARDRHELFRAGR